MLQAERIVLKDGYELTGDVLKNTDSGLVVDIGFMVLRLPKESVVEVIKEDSGDSASDPTVTVQQDNTTQWQIYHTASLKRATIEKNSEQYGEAVVMVLTPGGQGSGFMISPDGYLITNYHVIADETRIKITVFSRSKSGYEQKQYKKVKIVAFNPMWDLALLKIEEAEGPLKYVYMGAMDEVEAGQQVFAIGNPLGLTRSVSQGIVSIKNRNFSGQLYIQTTTDINPGNSGGPLFNLKGEVIGVTSMGYLQFGGLNFAIPTDLVKRFIKNRDAFAYDEDNPNAGYRYIQPAGRSEKTEKLKWKLPMGAKSEK
ncbi:MAG: trypsin-like peptidase domain-containing protein [Phycisphaerae bacterium]|nr:trypsin-like peptidase domain-containing protein [Phycisphaerae bacterium]